MKSDLDVIKEMLTKNGIEFEQHTNNGMDVLEVCGGYSGFYSNLSFISGRLVAIEAYE